MKGFVKYQHKFRLNMVISYELTDTDENNILNLFEIV